MKLGLYFLFAFTLTFSIRALAEEPSKQVKIGVIVPLSGDMALHGTEVQRAMTLALEESAGPALAYEYTLIFEDNRLEGAKSVSAAQKLLERDKVDAIVTLWPPTAFVVLPLTEKAEILHYTIAWDPEIAKQHKFLLSHQAMVNDIAKETLLLLKRQNKNKIAFFHMQESGFDVGARHIKALASELGMSIVADEAFNPSETDFRSTIERSVRKKPEGYLIWSVAPSLDILIHQLKIREPSAFVTGYFDYAEDVRQIQKTPYVSEMYTSPFFTKKYQEKYGEIPRSKAANAYDIMQLLIKAYESSPNRKVSASEAKDYLTRLNNHEGAVGTFSIDSSGNSSYSPVLRQVHGSERRLISAAP